MAFRLAATRRTPIHALKSTTRRTLFTSKPTPARSPLQTGLYTTVFAISAGLFAVYYFDSRSAIHRYVFTPVLRYGLDAETGQKVAVKVLRSGLGPRDVLEDDERLGVQLWGQNISNPVGLAAGFDKDGEAIDGLFDLGFGWVEIGSVTPKPQDGNPRPRVFHLPEDSALINRYGFPSQGHASMLSRLRSRLPAFPEDADVTPASLRTGSLLAVNLGKNKSSPPESIADFLSGIRAFAPYADVLVVNVSSPNTPGLRALQSRGMLEELLAGVTEERDALVSSGKSSRKPKLVLKISPDLDEPALAGIAEAVRNSNVDGVIVSNTTIQRPDSLLDPAKAEQGGLSGTPLKPIALKALRTLRAHLPESIPLIGCGGISTGSDALEYAKAGACAVQVYTGFGYAGVGACRRIKDELVEALEKEGTTWNDVVRKATAELSARDETKIAPAQVGQKSGGEVADVSVGQLIKEAEELKRMLDQFGQSLAVGDDISGSRAN